MTPKRFRPSAATVALLALAVAASFGREARAAAPDGAALVRLLGARADWTFAPSGGPMGALVPLAPGVSAASLGLEAIAPGFGRIRGTSAELVAFANAHPSARLEVAPPLHMLLDKSGRWTNAVAAHALKGIDGTGVLVGVADTGFDPSHPDFLDRVTGKSRVGWMLDLSRAPMGLYPDLEKTYGVTDGNGTVILGAVLTGADIDNLIAQKKDTPHDEEGHGTHVTSIAAGNGGATQQFVGMAPNATILFARVTRDAADSIGNDDLLDGVKFLFDRADAMGKPIAVNLSLGSDFGPHDGSMAWEETLASYVGEGHPGHALVVAAGNSGSAVESPVHQSVYVTHGARAHVPLTTKGALNGSVQIWVAMRRPASLSVGLVGPDGEWISPVKDGEQSGKNTSTYNAGVINGSSVAGSPVSQGSNGAVVIWSGNWPPGNYDVTLEGDGTAELFMQATGDAVGESGQDASFVFGVREGTINLPATNAGIIAAGCTVSRPSWTSIDGVTLGPKAPPLDGPGGLRDPDPTHVPEGVNDGDVCWFSSAGPTLTGVPKPEISAPGAMIVAAMSKQAPPGSPGSIFTSSRCPPIKAGGPPDPKCFQIDATHAVSAGTSMSSPHVAGAVALLFQRDPTLTQGKIVGLLQAGAHRFRSGAPRFEDQGGPGELDVLGSLDAMDQMNDPRLTLPSAAASWLTLSSDYVAADGSTALVAILELRTEGGAHRADFFDAARLAPVARVDDMDIEATPLVRKAPGVWFFTVTPPAGMGGRALTVGATFDGSDVVPRRRLPIAVDVWSSEYAPHASGSCAAAPAGPTNEPTRFLPWPLLVGLTALRRRRRPSRAHR